MEIKTVKIEIPEGYEVDNEKSTFQQIVFKKSEKKHPMSFNELGTIKGFYISDGSSTKAWTGKLGTSDIADHSNKNVFPSKEEAEAMLAMSQLCQLRDAWNEGWKPDFTDNTSKYCIINYKTELSTNCAINWNVPMVFKTRELCNKFFNTFKDLLEIAKPFL